MTESSYPMCGMDEMTVDYLVAALAMDIGQYDVATKKYGKGWSIPTAEQWKELFESCTLDYMVINKLYVAKFTGPNGKSIYLYFPPNDIYARVGNMEMSKQISAKLMAFITENGNYSAPLWA